MSAAIAVAALAAGAVAALTVAPGRRRLGGSSPAFPSLPDPRTALAHPRTPLGGALIAVSVVAAAAGPVPALAAGLVVRAVLVAGRDAVLEASAGRRDADWQHALRSCAAALRAGTVLATALRRGATAARTPTSGDGSAAERSATPRRLSTASTAVAGATTSNRAARQFGAVSPVAAILDAVAATAEMGGDPLIALRERCSSGPGAQLAAVLALAADVGAPPALLASRLADALTARARAGRATAVALAGTRATIRMLAALPLAGVALAGAFGASAPAYLLDTQPGHACLLAAALFEAAGLAWTRRLLAAAA